MNHDQSVKIIRSVYLSFFGTLGIIILVFLLFLAAQYTQQWLVHTSEVKSQIISINETLLSAESEQRAFMLTARPKYKESFRISVNQIDDKLAVLKEQTINNPAQQEYISELEELLSERVEMMANNIAFFKLGTLEENRQWGTKINVRPLIDRINKLKDIMLLEEERLLEERTSIYDMVYTTSLVVLSLALLLMLYSLWTLRQRLIPLFIEIENNNDDLELAVEQRKQEIALKDAQVEVNQDLINQLEDKNKQLNQFAYIASHDLQEPLRTVDNFVDLFQEEYGDKLDEDAAQYFSFIKGATVRMKGLITGLLNYSRLGKSDVKSEVDLDQTLKEIQEDFSTKIAERNVQINSMELPKVVGHPVELRQLFANLITNAIKFTPRERDPIINITYEDQKFSHQFKIEDNGLGIKEEHLGKIFNMFTRLHSAKDYEGTGIGLAFCQKIIELHRGKISVESQVGKGSTFTFTIRKK